MPNNLTGRFGMQVPHLFGRYSLPDVMSRLFHRGDTSMQPTQYTGGLSGGTYQPYSGGINAPDLNFNAYTGGDPMTPSTTTLNPGPGVQPIDFPLYAPDLNIKTGDGSGQSHSVGSGTTGGGSYGGGMYTSGTLGGGSVVDPSAWGQFGLGGAGGEQDSTGRKSQFATGMGEGGGYGLAGFMGPRPQSGGALPPQAAPNALTGGGLPPQQMSGPQTGGGLPPMQAPMIRTGGGMQPAPMAQNRLGGNFAYGYRPGQRVR